MRACQVLTLAPSEDPQKKYARPTYLKPFISWLKLPFFLRRSGGFIDVAFCDLG
jgi:hypothetical protein